MKIADEIKVALVTAACILAVAVISKNVLNVQLDFISHYAPSWMFIVYILTSQQSKKIKHNALYWSIAIVVVTAAVLALYSF
jgi:Mn2+/Fe2+ NRAMP family transporter